MNNRDIVFFPLIRCWFFFNPHNFFQNFLTFEIDSLVGTKVMNFGYVFVVKLTLLAKGYRAIKPLVT